MFLLICNIDKLKDTGLFIFTFIFFISIPNKSFENHFVVCQLGFDTNSFLILSVVTNLIYSCFLTFSIVFPKRELFFNLKNFFSKSFFASLIDLVLISMYGFTYAS